MFVYYNFNVIDTFIRNVYHILLFNIFWYSFKFMVWIDIDHHFQNRCCNRNSSNCYKMAWKIGVGRLTTYQLIIVLSIGDIVGDYMINIDTPIVTMPATLSIFIVVFKPLDFLGTKNKRIDRILNVVHIFPLLPLL